MASSPDWDDNLERVQRVLAGLAPHCDLAVLPENVLCLGAGATVRAAARSAAAVTEALAPLARTAQAVTVFGGVPVRVGADRVMNAALAFAPDGQLLARYDKVHLFQLDPDTPSGIDETQTYVHGDGPVAFAWQGWRVGLSICYDLRFPELFRACAPIDLALCTAAFTRSTGAAHWHVLLRARAIENQCYVAGVGQGGTNRETGMPLFGHSLAVAPWGEILAEAGPSEEETLHVELCKDRIAEARRRLPALQHRRLGLPELT
jgi:nitrilase